MMRKAFVLCVAACGSGSPSPDAGTLDTITVEPSPITLTAETSPPMQLSATLDGEDVTPEAFWTTSDPSIATIDEFGAVTAIAVGTATITANVGGTTGSASLVAIDPTLVVACTDSELLFYDAFATGSATPSHTLVGSHGSNGVYWQLASDGSTLYVTDAMSAEVDAWSIDAEGGPATVIAGTNTQLDDPRGIAIANGQLYVGGSNQIDVYDLHDSGDIAPVQIIRSSVGSISPIALAASGSDLYVADDVAARIEVFPLGASGSVMPSREIASPLFRDPRGIAVGSNGEIFVADAGSDDVPPAIDVVVDTDSESISELPIRRIAGPTSAADHGPMQLRLLGASLYFASSLDNAIVSVSAQATSDAPAATRLELPCSPRGLWFF